MIDGLPSSRFGRTSETVAFFEANASTVAQWLAPSLGPNWSAQLSPMIALSEVASALRDSKTVSCYALLKVDARWTVLLTDGPLGTDPGVLPSRAARDLSVRAIRATAVDPGSDSYPSAILAVYEPAARSDPQFCRRTVYAANDGGTWTFGEHGSPFPFEDDAAYQRRRVRDRLTPAMVRSYLEWLGVPPTDRLSVVDAWLVTRAEEP